MKEVRRFVNNRTSSSYKFLHDKLTAFSKQIEYNQAFKIFSSFKTEITDLTTRSATELTPQELAKLNAEKVKALTDKLHAAPVENAEATKEFIENVKHFMHKLGVAVHHRTTAEMQPLQNIITELLNRLKYSPAYKGKLNIQNLEKLLEQAKTDPPIEYDAFLKQANEAKVFEDVKDASGKVTKGRSHYILKPLKQCNTQKYL